jgi:hypothetical protein
MVTNRGFDVAPFTTISELGSKAHTHLVFIRPLGCPSDNQRHQSMTVICGASTADKSTQPAQACCVRASKDGRPRGVASARVNVEPVDVEDAEAGLRLRAANFRQGVAVTSARRRHRRTRVNARRVRREAEADGFLVDEMSRVILNGYRCARSHRAECFGKQSTLGGVRRNRRQSRSTSCPPIMASPPPPPGLLVRCRTWPQRYNRERGDVGAWPSTASWPV